MAESKQHMDHVRNIVSYIKNNISDCSYRLIQADLAEYGCRTPQVIGRFYPDVYYRTPDMIIIGEAKTDNDIDNIHTDSQIACYIDEVLYSMANEKHIILATSLYSFAMWSNRIIRLKEKQNLTSITFHIIDNMNSCLQI